MAVSGGPAVGLCRAEQQAWESISSVSSRGARLPGLCASAGVLSEESRQRKNGVAVGERTAGGGRASAQDGDRGGQAGLPEAGTSSRVSQCLDQRENRAEEVLLARDGEGGDGVDLGLSELQRDALDPRVLAQPSGCGNRIIDGIPTSSGKGNWSGLDLAFRSRSRALFRISNGSGIDSAPCAPGRISTRRFGSGRPQNNPFTASDARGSEAMILSRDREGAVVKSYAGRHSSYF